MPYGLISDLHCTNWSAFSSINASGVNTRLADIINVLDLCCEKTLLVGGNTVIIAGDLFHVRGNVSPSVFNPVKQAMEHWSERGISFEIIPGNHDLESDESTVLGSAVQMLASEKVKVFAEPTHTEGEQNIFFVPWIKNTKKFMDTLESFPDKIRGEYDVICHVGVNGILKGMPDHGINAGDLAAFGFKRVFAGHYHSHRASNVDSSVVSIGAATHQTFSDVGVKAGFLIVYPDRWEHFESPAPKFIELTDQNSHEISGNFVRVNIGKASAQEIQEYRQVLLNAGAKGCVINAAPTETGVTRVDSCVDGDIKIDTSIADYIRLKKFSLNVLELCLDIYQQVLR